MKNVSRKVLVAAMAGLLSGAAVRQAYADGTNIGAGANTNIVPGKAAPAKKMPKVHDCSGDNECKGLGGCKTDDNSCKFKNACKGKGGCALTKKDIQDWEKRQKEAAAKHPTP
ncbi:MAG TPA: hypothetical protein VGR14_17860 [Verrucomicrobiae bacterium]|jgi:hypothetical protein|nr:hypothetical protein [Verrucomicrobiae bacterium]